MAKIKHPTSFTVRLLKSDYASLERQVRVGLILEPLYLLTCPNVNIGKSLPQNPRDNGWKNPIEMHIGNDFFTQDRIWVKTMRYLAKSKLWDVIITMLLHDAIQSMDRKYGRIIVDRPNEEESVTAKAVLCNFGIDDVAYNKMIDKLKTFIIKHFGLKPRTIEPRALKHYQTGTIYDLWVYVYPDPEHGKIRFILSEEYVGFLGTQKTYCYSLHATASSPDLYVIVEQFNKIEQKEAFYRWIEQSFEAHYEATRVYDTETKSTYDAYVINGMYVKHILQAHPFYEVVEPILSDHQLHYLMQTLMVCNGVFTQVLITGPINNLN